MAGADGAHELCVFAPAPMLTVTLERRPDGEEELHIHPGGQGFWVARMARVLGASVTLCAPLGGETGDVLGHLITGAEIDLRAIPAGEPSGAYVHDRRNDERMQWWHASLTPLGRHDVDELYTATLAAALGAGVCVLTGTDRQDVLPEDLYTRLAADLRANGVVVLCDLQGALLRAVLEGGVDLVKISDEELVEDGWAQSDEPGDVVAGMHALREAGALDVVVSRAGRGALACLGDRWFEATTPEMTAVETAGAGDSMTAALAFGRAGGRDGRHLLQLAVAAGAVNVTRHGLGTGDAEAIERIAENVDVSELAVEAA